MAALVDNKTPRLNLPLPDRQNFLQDDVERLIETINDLDGEVALVAADGKLEPAQLPDNAAKVDANGILIESQLPVKVVTVDAQGKIPMGRIPAGALTNTHEASNEAQMLALPALVGDLCARLDDGATYMLTKTPGSVRANWREVPPSAVYSVNGKTGAITGIAASGENKDITKLAGLQGPLSLPADGINPYDAVTVRQLQSVTAGQGATMNGVMNNFIGAVEWFNGNPQLIPAGYIPANGQLESRTDPKTADLWTAVQSGMFALCGDTTGTILGRDSDWVDGPTTRGSFSYGDGTATTGTQFRVPDLNGVFKHPTDPTKNSIPGLFLRGIGKAGTNNNETGNSAGVVRTSAAPNIKGNALGLYGEVTQMQSANGPFFASNQSSTKIGFATAWLNQGLGFDASRVSDVYKDIASEVRPNSVQGIWIIRANGAFQAANTKFTVFNSDPTVPPIGTEIAGGELVSSYGVGGNGGSFEELSAKLTAVKLVGRTVAAARITAFNKGGGAYADSRYHFEFYSNGTAKAKAIQPACYRGMAVTLTPKDTGIIFEGMDVTSANVALKHITQALTSTAANNKWTVEHWLGIVSASNSTADGASWAFGATDGQNWNKAWMFTNGGKVIAPTSGGRAFYFDYAAGDLTTSGIVSRLNPTSDIYMKENIQDFDCRKALDNVNRLEFKTFTMKDDAARHINRGVIAQQARNVDANYVREDMEHLRMETYPLLMDALAAVKALSAEVDDLKSQVRNLSK
ncbi:tail fiber domain-containing protein [Escherichia coli]